MKPQRITAYVLVAAAALAFGFVLATQVRTGLINPSNRVGRNQALVNSVHDLAAQNAAYRDRIARLRAEIAAQESAAAQRSQADRQAEQDLLLLRAHAGLLPLRGPGVTVTLSDGLASTDVDSPGAHLTNSEDVQDIVNSLFAGGAEGVAVNGRRISPLTSFRGSGRNLLLDQGSPLLAPFRIDAVGDAAAMVLVLQDPLAMPDLRLRVERYHLGFNTSRQAEIALPAYDATLSISYAHAS